MGGRRPCDVGRRALRSGRTWIGSDRLASTKVPSAVPIPIPHPASPPHFTCSMLMILMLKNPWGGSCDAPFIPREIINQGCTQASGEEFETIEKGSERAGDRRVRRQHRQAAPRKDPGERAAQQSSAELTGTTSSRRWAPFPLRASRGGWLRAAERAREPWGA